MRAPPRWVVVATALGAAAALGLTWLVLREAHEDRSLTMLRWGSLLADALAVVAATAAGARLRGRWGHWTPAAAIGWIALATVAVVASEAGQGDWAVVDGVGWYLACDLIGSLVLVPLGGLGILFYAGVVVTPPHPRLPVERFVAVAATFSAVVAIPAAFSVLYLDLTGFEGFT